MAFVMMGAKFEKLKRQSSVRRIVTDRRRQRKIGSNPRRTDARRAHRSGATGLCLDADLGHRHHAGKRSRTSATRWRCRTPIEPPQRGSVCRIVTVPPDATFRGKVGANEVAAFFRAMGSPAASTYSPQAPHPYMQKTRTLDFCLILEGEITLVLDTAEVQLAAGDTVVQRGTNHAWSNRSRPILHHRNLITRRGGLRRDRTLARSAARRLALETSGRQSREYRPRSIRSAPCRARRARAASVACRRAPRPRIDRGLRSRRRRRSKVTPPLVLRRPSPWQFEQ